MRLKSAQLSVCEGSTRSRVPVSSPTTASADSCCHHDSVWRSHMTRSERRRLPVEPKVKVRPATRGSKTSDELQSGQYVTAIGWPPSLSLTISCQTRICTG